VHFIGSSRLGVYNINRDLVNPTTGEITTFERGRKFFELSNHLGNVLVTVSDKKIGVDVSPSDGIIDYYTADVITANDYSSFGATLAGREFNFDKSTHGYNGQVRDKAIQKDHHTALFWEYDPRIGRRWNIDPVPKSMVSPYVCLGNNPIMFVDPLGNDWYHNKKSHKTEWFDKRKEARKAGYKQHIGINKWIASDKPGIQTYYGNTKDQMWQFQEGENVTVTAKVKPQSLIGRSDWGRRIDADAREYRSLTPYKDIYNLRRRDGEALSQLGDPDDYTDNINSFETGYQIRKGFRDGGAISAGFFLAPFTLIAVAESGAVSFLYYDGVYALNLYGTRLINYTYRELILAVTTTLRNVL